MMICSLGDVYLCWPGYSKVHLDFRTTNNNNIFDIELLFKDSLFYNWNKKKPLYNYEETTQFVFFATSGIFLICKCHGFLEFDRWQFRTVINPTHILGFPKKSNPLGLTFSRSFLSDTKRKRLLAIENSL